jgi:hypothetical protein
MATKQVLLVAGFDYEFSGADFATLCKNRMTRLIKKFPKDKLVFTLFDVGAGDISKNEIKDPKKKDSMKNRKWTSLQSFTGVSSANYSGMVAHQENPFNANPAGIMSITDIYTFVQTIGAGPDAGSVQELSFFCHGWMGGPILVNSSDPTRDDRTQPRNSDDKDARPAKDFIPPTTSAAALANFTKAFSGSAFVWIWGCAFARAFNIILAEIFKTPIYNKTPRGKLKDSDLFKLEFTEDLSKPDGTVQFDAIKDKILLGGTLKAGASRSYKVDVKLQDIKTRFKLFLDASYSAVIAKSTHIKTYGALLGTYADYEKKPPAYPLMLIPQKSPPYDSDFTRTIRFYKAYLKVAIDPESRGYGTFLGT